MLYLKMNGMESDGYAQQLSITYITYVYKVSYILDDYFFKNSCQSVDAMSTSTVMNSGTYLKLALEEHMICLRN